MNYYFLPGTGIYGGVKVGFQFAQMLAELGVPLVVATPDGRAPDWFRASVPVVAHAAALSAAGPADAILFSLPGDYARLKTTPARLVFHCQGTDPLIDPILVDPDVAHLACWDQATSYIEERAGRRPIEVGIAISDCFSFDGCQKRPRDVAFMPRRGVAIAEAARLACPDFDFVAIDGATEMAAAAIMKRAAYFLATSAGEWFGLPALEAMAAGCVVVSVPTVGGPEFLRDGETAIVAPAAAVPVRLAALVQPGQEPLRARLRDNAVARARQYSRRRQISHLRTLLGGELRPVLSWT